MNDIAASWITKDRLPVLNVVRDYGLKTATLTQVSLRIIMQFEGIVEHSVIIKLERNYLTQKKATY